MLGVTSGQNYFETGGIDNYKKKKCYMNLDSITFQRKSHDNCN